MVIQFYVFFFFFFFFLQNSVFRPNDGSDTSAIVPLLKKKYMCRKRKRFLTVFIGPDPLTWHAYKLHGLH